MNRTVSQYTGLNVKECESLDCDEFLLYYRNAIVEQLNMTEKGREILNNFRISQLDEDEALDELDKLLG